MLALLHALLLVLGHAAPASEPPPPDPSTWNVLVITADAARPDRMSLYGHDRPTTPYLDDFADEAVVFDNAFATGAWTSPGIASLFTGLHPAVHGQDTRFDHTDDLLQTPLDVLRAEGAFTVARDIDAPSVRGLGFQAAYRPVLTDPVAVAEWLGGLDRRFVAWIHVKTTHLPYDPSPFAARRFGGDRLDTPAIRAVRSSNTVYPRDYGLSWDPPVIEAFTPEEQAVVRDLYDGAMYDLDTELGQMIEHLRAVGVLDRTLVILTADHGEELFDQGWVGHASTGYEGKVSDALLRIPLLVRLPGGTATGRVGAFVQQHDLMPTVFELLGLDPARVDGGFQGRSLVPHLRGEPAEGPEHVFARTTFKGWTTPRAETTEGLAAIRDATRKVVLGRRGGREVVRAYDLEADPTEQTDVYADDPARFADLLVALRAHEAENAERAVARMMRALDRRLEALEEAARDGDALAAARHWVALLELQETHATDPTPPLALSGRERAWERGLARAARLRARAER
jgi:choline-sulfatase